MADVRIAPDVELAGFANLTPPAAVSDGTRVGVRLSRYGDMLSGIVDPDLSYLMDVNLFGEAEVAPRYLMFQDFLGDSVDSTIWTTTSASGGATATSAGESTLTTSAAANGSAYILSPKLRYKSGITYEWGGYIRVGDTGTANNTRRWGVMTMSGTTPQDGYYFELSGTTFNAVSVKAGSATATAVGSWTRNATAPFTLDTNYHRYEIMFTGELVVFTIDGIVRHVLAENAVATPRTTTNYFPATIQNTNGSNATNITLGIRGAWIAKYGDNKPSDISEVLQNKVAQYTTTQTSTDIWTPATGKSIRVSTIQIQAGGTTAGAVQIYFGTGAYSRGTSRTVFDGEFAPSATLKPGVFLNAPPHGWEGLPDDHLRITDAAAINPLTVNVWGYEV